MTSVEVPGPLGRVGRVASQVSTLELLLDLVFVFTISQVAGIIVADPTWVSIARAAVTMALVWWMYDAFVWLTNQSAPDTTVIRFLLIAAMAAFLVMSLAIPDAFGSSGTVFGIAYLVVVLIHAGIFIGRAGPGGLRTIVGTAPINVTAALLLIASGFVTGPLDWLFFLLPLPLFAIAGSIAAGGGIRLEAPHFVERHGLLMIIAFGESIVSVGAGLTGHRLGGSLIIGAIAAVAMVAALWWCYFAGDDERARGAFSGARGKHRTTLALTGFYLCHLVMILGLVAVAAGLHLVVPSVFTAPSPPAAWLLAGGVAAYLLGDAEYRRELGLGPWRWRVLGALLCVAAGAVGPAIPTIGLLLVLIVIVAAVAVTDGLRRPPTGSSASSTS
jgi:low temperature requirement protein LtrA